MALQTAAQPAAPASAAIPNFAQQAATDNSLPGTSNAALASSQTLTAGLPPAYASHVQSFPMVPPSLSVMVPTNTANQRYNNSPNTPQACSIVVQTPFSSLQAQHVPSRLHLQVDMLSLRLTQDLAFQQAVQQSHIQAAAKAAVSLLGVRPALQPVLAFHTTQSATCTCTEHVAL